jgi:HAD domain in Swiss Army Knife RNA repair proteins
MKVIFLDIDGVLNCKNTPNPRKFPYIVDPKLLKRFKRLLQCTGAKVVLSSTWRYDPAGLFSAKHWGIPFIDVIPDMPKRPRRDEVLAWLKTHPKVKRFVVIDDEDDELDQLPLFQPSASNGLTEKIATGIASAIRRITAIATQNNAPKCASLANAGSCSKARVRVTAN